MKGNRKSLNRRLVYLFTGELSAILVFTFLFFYFSFNTEQSYSLFLAFFILLFILLQASAYWLIKWKHLRTHRPFPAYFSNLLRSFKKINLLLLSIVPVTIFIDLMSEPSLTFRLFSVMMLIYGFAIIEYINYFHIQLTNYKNGRWKKASIAKEISKEK
ncbi:hypothetical protein K8O68_11005 [Salipaludibacillus sp. CUR1]|uniref:hypothetical protein n=1 Tax=Salipaludibacillus sp. CUR1 TaxID=2820003 RepID=UPI001E5E8C05|nr:hypothetical protein [Salipaludibacillus sp. CUR1]MCE7792944.1 hypothetical protein [Salipaludibacillus sp. CUR1]